MRILGMAITMIFLAAGLSFATTLNLTDGRSVQGDILKQDNKSLQISVDGVTMTYYADEIKDIDGKPFGDVSAPPADNAQPEAVAPVPVAQPETVASPAAAQPEANAPASVAQGPVTMPSNAVQPAASAPVGQVEAASPAPVPAGTIAPDKKALILKFMDVFGTRQALNNNFNAMIAQIAKDKPDEAQTISQRVKINEIIDRLLPIYDRNFTSDDLKAFISFYESDEGQKLIKTIPLLMKESVQESIKYMQEKFPEVNKGQ